MNGTLKWQQIKHCTSVIRDRFSQVTIGFLGKNQVVFFFVFFFKFFFLILKGSRFLHAKIINVAYEQCRIFFLHIETLSNIGTNICNLSIRAEICHQSLQLFKSVCRAINNVLLKEITSFLTPSGINLVRIELWNDLV